MDEDFFYPTSNKFLSHLKKYLFFSFGLFDVLINIFNKVTSLVDKKSQFNNYHL